MIVSENYLGGPFLRCRLSTGFIFGVVFSSFYLELRKFFEAVLKAVLAALKALLKLRPFSTVFHRLGLKSGPLGGLACRLVRAIMFARV
jgi:hypothetical protein